MRNAWQVADDDVAWVLPRLRPTPLRHFTEPLQLGPSIGGEQRPRVYIRCTENNPAPHFDDCALTAQSSPGWTYRELELPHLPFIRHPAETAEVSWTWPPE